MTESNNEAGVLIVDDEAEVADVYELRLRDEYDTETAYGGEEALEVIGDDIDIVLLDRRMPVVSGDDVLEEIRDQGLDCRVIMITAVDPDFDIVEMPFDDYLCKPVQKEDLVGAIEQQLTATRYDDRLTEYIETSSKLALLEAEKPESELKSHEEVNQLRDQADQLRDDMDEVLDDVEDFDAVFQEIGRHAE